MPFKLPWTKETTASQFARRPAPEFPEGSGPESVVHGTLPTGPWDPVSELPYPGLDLAMFFSGSIAKVVAEYMKAIRVQELANANLATATAVVTTPDDLGAINNQLRANSDSVTLSVRQGAHTYIREHPDRAALTAGVWETLGNHIGCASDPDFGLDVLATDPLATQSLDTVVERTLAQLRRHNLVGGCTVLEHVGAGGSYVVGEYLLQAFARSMPITRHHRVLYLGSATQFLNRAIARRWLSEFLAEPIPDNTLLYLVSLDHPGRQAWDLALAHGFLTLTATDRIYGQGDAYNHFTRLKTRGDVVSVKAHVVSLPLRRLEKRSRFGRRETHYVLQDSPVPALLATLKRRVDAAPRPYRLVVFTGNFDADEVAELHRRAQVLAPLGSLEVLVNWMAPLTHNHERADFYMVEFTVADGEPAELLELVNDSNLHPNGGAHWDQDHLAARLAQANGNNGAFIPTSIRDLLASGR